MTYVIDTEARHPDRLAAPERNALRALAAMVAEGAKPAELFAAVAQEAARVLEAQTVFLARYESNRTITALASLNAPGFPVGGRWPVDGPSLAATILETARPARSDDSAELGGAIAVGVGDTAMQSAVGVPIVVDGRIWGLLCVGTTGPDPLAADVESRLVAFAELAVVSISNAESRERGRRVADEQAALRRVATLVAEGVPAAELFASVMEEIVRGLDVPVVALLRYEPEREATVLAAVNAHAFPIGSRSSLDDHRLAATVFETGRPAHVDGDAAVGLPIVVDGRLWGLICVGSAGHGPLHPDTESGVRDFTELIATAVSNADSRDRRRRLADEQAALRRVATLVAESATPMELFSAVALEVARVLELASVSVVRYDSDGASTVVASLNDPSFPVGSRWPLDGPSLNAIVLETGKSAQIDYTGLQGPVAEAARASGVHVGVAVPIIVDGSVWGMIAVGRRSRRGGQLPRFAGTYTSRIVLSTESAHETEARLGAFTELLATAISNADAREHLRGLAEEQAALHRVAAIVARGTDSSAIFAAVCAEAGQLVGATSVNLSYYTPDGFNVTMAGWSVRDTHVPVGSRFPLTSDTVGGVIVQTHAPARIDSWEGATSELASLIRSRGIRSSLGAPVVVEGQLWGALVAATDQEENLPAGTESRLARFTELVATAVSNATARADLLASRARIVAAGDEARRRIERNLHDGTQQRLIALGLDLQRVQATIPADQQAARSGLESVQSDLESVLEEVRELSRGLHPALLARHGLGPSLNGLARKSSIPVEVDIEIDERPPASIETAVYYVVSEALTNAIKHSRAATIAIGVATRQGWLRATIADDGVGGAEAGTGSGLTGLSDRVEALGGRFSLESPLGDGTTITIELPIAAAAGS